MAPRGQKRVATVASAGEPGQKRVAEILKSVGVSKALYKPAVEVVRHPLSELSEDTRKMLLAAMPWSLCVEADKRDETQAAVVRMIGSVVETIQGRMHQGIDEKATKVIGVVGGMAEARDEVQCAEILQTESHGGAELCQSELDEAACMQESRQTALTELELEEKKHIAELEEVRSQRRELEAVLDGSFRQLKHGVWKDEEVSALVEEVRGTALRCALEESLLLVLPACFTKRERGSFDQAVVAETEQGLRGKLADLSEAVEGASSKLTRLAAEAQTTRAELDAATEARAQAASMLSAAREAYCGATAAAEASRTSAAELEVRLVQATAERDAKVGELDAFRTYHLHMFGLLRDRTSDQQQEDRQCTLRTA